MNLKTRVINKLTSNNTRIMVRSKENKACHISGCFLVLMVMLF